MIVGLAMMLLFIGMVMMTMDIFVPPISVEMLTIIMMNRLLGIVFFIFGVMLLGVRLSQTGIAPLLDLPNKKRVILFHQRRGRNPNTHILTGELKDLEFIRSKNKLFKDTGGGFRISGHDCRRTHETICHDIPEWLSEYFYQIKQKYGINNSDEFQQLRKALKGLKQPGTIINLEGDSTPDIVKELKGKQEENKVPGMEDQLRKIKLLEVVMENPERKKDLLNMSLQQLQHMDELLFDGITHHGEEIEQFIESSTPNELDALEKQAFLNDMMRQRNYSEPGEMNWGKWVPAMGFLLLCGALAAIMLQGVFGS